MALSILNPAAGCFKMAGVAFNTDEGTTDLDCRNPSTSAAHKGVENCCANGADDADQTLHQVNWFLSLMLAVSGADAA